MKLIAIKSGNQIKFQIGILQVALDLTSTKLENDAADLVGFIESLLPDNFKEEFAEVKPKIDKALSIITKFHGMIEGMDFTQDMDILPDGRLKINSIQMEPGIIDYSIYAKAVNNIINDIYSSDTDQSENDAIQHEGRINRDIKEEEFFNMDNHQDEYKRKVVSRTIDPTHSEKPFHCSRNAAAKPFLRRIYNAVDSNNQRAMNIIENCNDFKLVELPETLLVEFAEILKVKIVLQHNN